MNFRDFCEVTSISGRRRPGSRRLDGAHGHSSQAEAFCRQYGEGSHLASIHSRASRLRSHAFAMDFEAHLGGEPLHLRLAPGRSANC